MQSLHTRIHITSHAVCSVPVRIEKDGTTFVPRMTYTKNGRTTLRQAMETGEPGETIKQTLFSGVTHELAKNLGDFEWRLLSASPVYSEIGADKDNPGGSHLKTVHVVEVIKGELRDTPLVDGDELLGPIVMVPVEDLLREINPRNTVPFHVFAVRAALNFAASDRNVLDRYYKEVVIWQPATLTEEEKRAIDEYAWK